MDEQTNFPVLGLVLLIVAETQFGCVVTGILTLAQIASLVGVYWCWVGVTSQGFGWQAVVVMVVVVVVCGRSSGEGIVVMGVKKTE